MATPCNLSKEDVEKYNDRIGRHDHVPLIGNICQNPRADGSSGVCGRALGAHPSEQGKIYCNYLYLVEI
jgi:hypothetical protein